MKGIDISSYQGSVNLAQVKASGIEIVYIKATEGISYTDSNLSSYYNQAKTAGLKVGFYHLLKANNSVSEAQYFLKAIENLKADCKYIIDVEETLGQQVSQINSNVEQFSNYLKTQSKDVGIYTYTSFYNSNLNATVKNLPLWVAEYGVSAPQISNFIGWQYSDTGSVSGITVSVDLDTFTESIFISNQEEKKVNNLVVYLNAIDQVYADTLAVFLKCPTINGDIPFDYTIAKNIYCVGAPGKLPFTSYATKIFTGKDRSGTLALVNAFIANYNK